MLRSQNSRTIGSGEKSRNSVSVFVSHAGKQYVHRVVQGLLTNGRNVFFCTPIWFQKLPRWLSLLPSSLQRRLTSELRKRLFLFQGNIHLITFPLISIRKELAERIRALGIDRAQLNLEKQQDRFASGKIAKVNPELVIGYEISSVQTFRKAHAQKIITVLDLAQIHYLDILEIAGRFPAMDYILKNPCLKEINERKQAEYETADFILTLSSYARQSLLSRGFHSDKVYEVNLGFDAALFTPKAKYRTQEEFRMMISGTDMIRKGLGLLLEVFNGLIQKGYDLKLTVVGPAGEIDKILDRYGRPASVSATGFLAHEEMVREYQEADLFVFPSYLDSWAMTVLEAMACGTPVIVSENTGSKAAVQQGGGLVVPAGDHSALEEAIKKFYHNRDMLVEYGKTAKAVAAGYTWENYYRRLNEVITDIVKKSEGKDSK